MSESSVLEQLFETACIQVVNSTELYPALHKTGDRGLPVLVVKNRLGRAVVALQGAQLMEFQPVGQREMFWISPRCVFEAGRPIRAGIPLCLPWFGPGRDGAIQHGFARVMDWKLVAAEACADGTTRIVLELASEQTISPMWPHAFSFRLEVAVGSGLRLGIRAENRSHAEAPFAFAFHTYFAVPSIADAQVSGLEGTTFIDKIDNSERKVQQGEIAITALTDRIYLDVPAVQTLKTASGNVKIESDTKCAVVWNAWTNDKNMEDLGEGNHMGYLCVERCDVADRAVTIPAGGAYASFMKLSY
jgi:glucose-6-phosphate 1-epimerase